MRWWGWGACELVQMLFDKAADPGDHVIHVFGLDSVELPVIRRVAEIGFCSNLFLNELVIDVYTGKLCV